MKFSFLRSKNVILISLAIHSSEEENLSTQIKMPKNEKHPKEHVLREIMLVYKILVMEHNKDEFLTHITPKGEKSGVFTEDFDSTLSQESWLLPFHYPGISDCFFQLHGWKGRM